MIRSRCRRRALVTLAVSLSVLPIAVPTARADWPVFGHDPARTGRTSDTSLSDRTVASLRQRWTLRFDDVADSTPILLSRVRFARGAPRAMLYQTTRRGTTYGIAAANGAVIWRFATHGPKITTSTPAADPSGAYIYAPGVDGLVHKLAAATGREVRAPGLPVRITRMPDVEKNASALNIANGYLYAATSGYIGDQGPYDGHIVAVHLRDGVTHVFNTLCSNVRHLLLDTSYDAHSAYTCAQATSGIWSRSGVVVDPDPTMGGRIYVATGNGRFNGDTGGADYGDSVLALSADGSRLLDHFTPANYAELQSSDTDLGSTAPVMLPRDPRSRTPLMAVQGGKDGLVRLLDRSHLGGVHGEMQDLAVPGATLFSAPAVWQARGRETWIYLGDGSSVSALRVRTDRRGVSRLVAAWTAAPGGTSPVVADGVVFVATDGAVNAYNALTGRRLWSSADPGAEGSIGGIHWESPIVVHDRLYISDESGHLSAYAL